MGLSAITLGYPPIIFASKFEYGQAIDSSAAFVLGSGQTANDANGTYNFQYMFSFYNASFGSIFWLNAIEMYKIGSPDQAGSYPVYHRNFVDPFNNYIQIGTIKRSQTGGTVYTTNYLSSSDVYTRLKNGEGTTTTTGFDTSTDTSAAYHFSTTQASATKLTYQLQIKPGTTRLVLWKEVFTPDDPTVAVDTRWMSWNPDPSDTLSQSYTIDPFDTTNPHRFGSTPGTYNVKLVEATADIAVDNNRDGYIALYRESTADATTSATPFHFWLNDDDDGTPTDEADHVGSTHKDYEDLTITSRRDLEDFARLHLSLAGLESAITGPNPSIYIGLKWKNTVGTPAINIYKAVETDGGTKYLTDLTTAGQQAPAVNQCRVVPNKDGNYVSVDTSGTFIFSPSFWTGLNASGGKKYLLFEGAGIGTGQLTIVLLDKDSNPIGEGPGVWFDLKSIRSMYQRVKVTPHDPNGIPPPFLGDNFDANSSGSEPSDDGYPFVAPPDEAKTALVFVHGSNISYETSKSHADTMFKRLWWRGYKGRLALFYWDTLVGPWDGTVPAHYNLNEYRALKYGWALKNYVENALPSDYAHNVIGHSMGNAVVASALRAREAVNGSTIPGMTARNVVLMNAAVSASCFQSGAATLPELASLENPQTTPDTVGQLGYRGMAATGVNATLFSVYNINDYALFWWIKNQRLRKPEDLTNPVVTEPPFYTAIAVYPRQYTWTTAGGGQLWDWSNFTTGPVRIRYVDDITESMAFIARSRTAATGRMNVGGSISDDFNIGEGSTQMPDQFGDSREDHSGAFTREIQQLTPLYQYIFEKAR